MIKTRTSGAVAVEFALVSMAFVSMLLLALEVGWQLAIDSALGAGARGGARYGSTGATVAGTLRTDSIRNEAIQNSGNLLLHCNPLTITEASYASFAALEAGGASTAGPGNASQVVQYTFTCAEDYLTPIAGAITGQRQLIHSVQVTVLNEPFPTN